jgi:hypothetical protein
VIHALWRRLRQPAESCLDPAIARRSAAAATRPAGCAGDLAAAAERLLGEWHTPGTAAVKGELRILSGALSGSYNEPNSPCPLQKERTKDETPGGRHEPRRAPDLQRRRGGGVARYCARRRLRVRAQRVHPGHPGGASLARFPKAVPCVAGGRRDGLDGRTWECLRGLVDRLRRSLRRVLPGPHRQEVAQESFLQSVRLPSSASRGRRPG